VYRLAVLAESWIYELIGNLELSIEILERLGLERGYETDTDRLEALATLYEKLGTPSALESVINICKYLESRSDQSDVLGRLAVLHHRLGDEAAAEEYERRHLAAYLRAMHRPSLAEVVTAAARHFLPLEKLRAIHFFDSALPAKLTPREAAIARALQGDLEGAKKMFAAGAEILDIKYLADLEALSSDEKRAERATALYARALREDPTDPHVIAWLLDRWAKTKSKTIAAIFRDESILAPVLESLESAVHERPGESRLWKRLATLFALQEGEHPQARQFAERASLLERNRKQRSQGVGRVLSAAIYRFAGRVNGLIHEVWATREMAPPGEGGILRRDDILGNLTNEMRDNVRNTFLAVREYAQAKFPHLTRDILNYNYGYKVTKEDEPSGGTSAGLPTALAFLSVFLQRPLHEGFASTGMLVTDAHDVLTVRAVGDIEHKVDGAYHRNLDMIIVPAGNRPVLEHSGVVPRVVREEIVRYVADLDEVVGIVFEGVDKL
jgi:tetratricopeptide (TPR) repeat protein